MSWVDAGAIADMEFSPGHAVRVDGRWIALFHVDGDFLAIDNACPHAGAPLCDGMLQGESIVCALHLWEFDPRTGRTDVGPEWGVATYRTRVRGDRIEVDLPDVPK